MSNYQSILYNVTGRIARITFNRPERRNAMDLSLRCELVDALKIAERDDSVSIIVIDGAGPAFCSGYDVGGGAYTAPEGGYISEKFDYWTDQFARNALKDWLTIWDLLKPVVCKVHGACLAGGTEIMSMCDLSFATDDARIGYPAVRAQSTPDVPSFAWKLPMARAKYLQLSGNIVSGKTAADWGWITKSFPADEFDQRFEEELAALASIEPDMLSASKQSINQQYDMMGFRAGLSAAISWHFLSARVRPNAGKFREIADRNGFKAAVEWRDSAFKGIDFK